MSTSTLSRDEIGDAAERIYRERIRPVAMPAHKGEFAAIDVDSGDYEMDCDDLAAEERLLARHPTANGFLIRIGYREAESLGGRLTEDE